MVCKDCISFSRCKEMYEAFGVSIDLENSAVCKHFKNKADFVEVVRCKDCKHWKKYENTAGAGNCKKREFSFEYGNEHTFNPITMPDFNCSYGERSDT